MFGEDRLKDLLVKYAKADSAETHRAHHGGGGAVDRRGRIAGRYDHGGGAAHMKVLTAAEMREVDRRTIEAGIPGIVLMENAGHRVVEFLARTLRAARGAAHRGAVRQGQQRRRRPGGRAPACTRDSRPRPLHVVLLADPAELEGRCGGQLQNAAGRRRLPVDARNSRRGARRHAGRGRAAGHRRQRRGHRAHAGGHPRDQPRISAGQGGGRGHSVRHAERFRRAARANSRAPITP